MKRLILFTITFVLFIITNSNINSKSIEDDLIEQNKPKTEIEVVNKSFTGISSYYHDMFDGRTTANGEIFKQNKLTAAHKELPFGTKLKVTNLSNNKEIIVVINDRGPFIKGRVLDLSKRGAEELGFVNKGLQEVKMEIIN